MSEKQNEHDKGSGALMEGLLALDEAIRKSIGSGTPGEGFYALQSASAAQFFGVKAPPFPAKKAEPEPEAEPKHETAKEPPKATATPPHAPPAGAARR